jgi:hypothetical protein
MPVCLCLYAYLLLRLSVCPSVVMFACPTVCLFSCLLVSLNASLIVLCAPIYLSTLQPICQSVYLPFGIPVHLSFFCYSIVWPQLHVYSHACFCLSNCQNACITIQLSIILFDCAAIYLLSVYSFYSFRQVDLRLFAFPNDSNYHTLFLTKHYCWSPAIISPHPIYYLFLVLILTIC